MQHHHQSNSVQNKSLVGHVVFLIVAILLLAGLYLYFQSELPVVWGAAGLALAHLAAAAGILYLTRTSLAKLIQKMHGAPASTPMKIWRQRVEQLAGLRFTMLSYRVY